MTRSRDTANTQENVGGAVAPFVAGKNKIINGDFGVWQRGTSINLTSATGTYTADRFRNAVTFSAGTCTVSRQAFTPGTAPVSGYEGSYFHRTTLPASGSITYYETTQFIEGVQTYAGQTVTLSFWAKASSSITLTSLFTQNFGSGGSTNVDTGGSTHAVTTSWQRFTVTIAMPSIAGKTIGTSSYIGFYIYTTTGLTTSMTIDLWGVQLESGSVATPFTTASGTLQGELALCQRYYYRATAGGTTYSGDFPFGMGIGSGSSGTGVYAMINFPVTMRTQLSSTIDFSGLDVLDATNSRIAVTSVTLSQAGNVAAAVTAIVASGIVQYRPYFLCTNNNNTGYLGFSAEL